MIDLGTPLAPAAPRLDLDAASAERDAIATIADAARLESERPEAALALFANLASRPDFPYRDIARERRAVLLWRLGRRGEAVREYRASGADAPPPEPSYLRARRAILRLSQIAFRNGGPLALDAPLRSDLGRAAAVFERNGDLFMIARLHRLRAGGGCCAEL